MRPKGTLRSRLSDRPSVAARSLLTLLAVVVAWATVTAASPGAPGASAPAAPEAAVAGEETAQDTAARSGPILVVPAKEVDVGEVFRGEPAEARFELRNEGDETLHILRAKPG
jgi:hypothetical protein